MEDIRSGHGTSRHQKTFPLLTRMMSTSDTNVKQFAEVLSQTKLHKNLGDRLLKALETAPGSCADVTS